MADIRDTGSAKLEEWFNRGRELLKAGKITAAHKAFAQIAAIHPTYPNLGHALAVSLPNSFLIKITGQFEKHNIEYASSKLAELIRRYAAIRLLIIDLSGIRTLPHFAIDLLRKLERHPSIILKLIELEPKPRQILNNLNFQHLIWTDRSCPVCGPQKICVAKFSNRKRFEIVLPEPDFD